MSMTFLRLIICLFLLLVSVDANAFICLKASKPISNKAFNLFLMSTSDLIKLFSKQDFQKIELNHYPFELGLNSDSDTYKILSTDTEYCIFSSEKIKSKIIEKTDNVQLLLVSSLSKKRNCFPKNNNDSSIVGLKTKKERLIDHYTLSLHLNINRKNEICRIILIPQFKSELYQKPFKNLMYKEPSEDEIERIISLTKENLRQNKKFKNWRPLFSECVLNSNLKVYKFINLLERRFILYICK